MIYYDVFTPSLGEQMGRMTGLFFCSWFDPLDSRPVQQDCPQGAFGKGHDRAKGKRWQKIATGFIKEVVSKVMICIGFSRLHTLLLFILGAPIWSKHV